MASSKKKFLEYFQKNHYIYKKAAFGTVFALTYLLVDLFS